MILQRIDDSMNPIVVKELRQAVQSRFVVAVLLLFLLLQLVMMGIFLVSQSIGGQVQAVDFQAGRDVFLWLQVILLATCLLFVPIYTGLRLLAERSDVNVDLLFITTLRPRYIISGKFLAAVVLVILIFSACTPFMAFTYFLRGIDLPSIFFVVGLDFVAVLAAVMMTIFAAVVPGNRVVKSLLGMACAAGLLGIFGMIMGTSVSMISFGMSSVFESREFYAGCAVALAHIFGALMLFYAWSVSFVTPPAANRALLSRLMLLLYLVASGILSALCGINTSQPEFFYMWVIAAVAWISLYLVIAINERDRWGPRLARTIPRNWLLRLPALLFYSGAFGGILFALLCYVGVLLAVIVSSNYIAFYIAFTPRGIPRDLLDVIFNTCSILFLYTYCYALTATIFRKLLLPQSWAGVTWVVMLILLALGSAGPYILSFMVHWRDWNFNTHYPWLLTNPVAAAVAIGDRHFPQKEVFVIFAAIWAGVVGALNIPWFFKQLRNFKPYVPPAPAAATQVALDVTQQL